jgi:hypothetical protein
MNEVPESLIMFSVTLAKQTNSSVYAALNPSNGPGNGNNDENDENPDMIAQKLHMSLSLLNK